MNEEILAGPVTNASYLNIYLTPSLAHHLVLLRRVYEILAVPVTKGNTDVATRTLTFPHTLTLISLGVSTRSWLCR